MHIKHKLKNWAVITFEKNQIRSLAINIQINFRILLKLLNQQISWKKSSIVKGEYLEDLVKIRWKFVVTVRTNYVRLGWVSERVIANFLKKTVLAGILMIHLKVFYFGQITKIKTQDKLYSAVIFLLRT